VEEPVVVSSAGGLVGREAELALAAAAVRHLTEGRSSVLVIEGEAGIGKTRLVQSIIDDARSRDVAVFCGQAHPFERARPFGVVAAALGLTRRSPDSRRTALGELLDGRAPEPGRRPAATSSTGSWRRS
jgi:predicted ATPase